MLMRKSISEFITNMLGRRKSKIVTDFHVQRHSNRMFKKMYNNLRSKESDWVIKDESYDRKASFINENLGVRIVISWRSLDGKFRTREIRGWLTSPERIDVPDSYAVKFFKVFQSFKKKAELEKIIFVHDVLNGKYPIRLSYRPRQFTQEVLQTWLVENTNSKIHVQLDSNVTTVWFQSQEEATMFRCSCEDVFIPYSIPDR